MAGQKLSPRQKMINLMYLVFIAMLALTMSKKVLTSFGRVYEDLKTSVKLTKEKNNDLLGILGQKAQEQPQKYGEKFKDAQKVNEATLAFHQYMSDFQEELLKKSKQDPNNPDYESLDKGYILDELFFRGDKYNKKGEEFVNKINEYRETLLEFAKKYGDEEMIKRIKYRFNTDPIKEGASKISWLHYYFEDFPLIASLTNMARLENNALLSENELLSSMLQGQLMSDVSMKNYQAIVLLDKSAFFPTEKVTGKIILGRFDNTLQFEKATLNGKEVPKEKLQHGQVLIEMPAGNPGDKTLKGELVFKEGDSLVKLPFEYAYSVIPMPNSAVISADKMNVLYKGVDNPLSISVPGIPDNKIKVTAPGIRKIKNGKYIINVTNYPGRTVDIVVTWTLPNGQTKRDKKTFRVKNIPTPLGAISGQTARARLPKRNVEIGTVSAVLPDFDFDVKIKVVAFDFKAPGQPTIHVVGNRLNERAKSALRRVKRGQTVQIYGIKTKLVGNDKYKLKEATPVIIEITN
ncbi:MAG: gliding motility protein GldM [Chlorobi bacterium]|nr:gliding motility protein GldM [Chlorobiota bacterium]